MQFPRSTVQLLSENFESDDVSTSSNSGSNQQFLENGMLNPVDTRNTLQYLPSPIENAFSYESTVSHDAGFFSGWNHVEPRLSEYALSHARRGEAMINEVDINSVSDDSRSKMNTNTRTFEPTSIFSLETVSEDLNNNQIANVPPFIRSSSPNSSDANLDVSRGRFVANVDHDNEAAVSNGPHKSIGSDHGQIPSHSGSDPCASASGTQGHHADESHSKLGCSLDRLCFSRKRKAMEASEPSLCASSSCFQQAESSKWLSGPIQQNTSGDLNISNDGEYLSCANPPNELMNEEQEGGVNTASECHLVNGNPSIQSSRRNFRWRINSVNQIFSQTNPWHPWNSIGHPLVQRPLSPSSSNNISDQCLDPSLNATNTTSIYSRSHALDCPEYLLDTHPYHWVGTSSIAGGSPHPPLSLGERSACVTEVTNLSRMSRDTSENAKFVPVSTQDPANVDPINENPSVLRSSNIPENASQTLSTLGGHALPVPAGVPQQHRPLRHPRRLLEVLPRPIFSSFVSDFEASTSNNPTACTDTISSQETLLPSRAGHQGHHAYLRRPIRMDSMGDDAHGVQMPLSEWTSGSQGRSRLASEIRNVLELIRSGENIRFEDAHVLDRSILFGRPDRHDRHRDMRLDVDNMSYEELLALEERIGNVSTGLAEETISKCLKQKKHSCIAMAVVTEVEPCCICREDYVHGDDLGTLDCEHDFHTECIKKWLMVKNLCPICRMTALVT